MVAKNLSAAMEVMVATFSSMNPTPCRYSIRRDNGSGTVVNEDDDICAVSWTFLDFVAPVVVVVILTEERDVDADRSESKCKNVCNLASSSSIIDKAVDGASACACVPVEAVPVGVAAAAAGVDEMLLAGAVLVVLDTGKGPFVVFTVALLPVRAGIVGCFAGGRFIFIRANSIIRSLIVSVLFGIKGDSSSYCSV